MCVEEVLITLCSLRARPVLMHFLLLLSFSSPLSAPSACFSADSGLWQSYLPFNTDQSPSYLQLLNHKHFIGSTLTLTDTGRRWFAVKCLWRPVDAGLHSVRGKCWARHPVKLSPALKPPLPSCTAVALSQRETHCLSARVHVRSHI